MFRLRETASFPCSHREHRASANGKHRRHKGFHPLCIPIASRATDDAPHRLTRTRSLIRASFAFAASKRTAKIWKLTRTGIATLIDWLGGNFSRFGPRARRGYENWENSLAFIGRRLAPPQEGCGCDIF